MSQLIDFASLFPKSKLFPKPTAETLETFNWGQLLRPDAGLKTSNPVPMDGDNPTQEYMTAAGDSYLKVLNDVALVSI